MDASGDKADKKCEECSDEPIEVDNSIERIENRIIERITNLTIDLSILRFHGRELNEDGRFQEINKKAIREVRADNKVRSSGEDETKEIDKVEGNAAVVNDIMASTSGICKDIEEPVKGTIVKVRRVENENAVGGLITVPNEIDDVKVYGHIDHIIFTDSSSVEESEPSGAEEFTDDDSHYGSGEDESEYGDSDHNGQGVWGNDAQGATSKSESQSDTDGQRKDEGESQTEPEGKSDSQYETTSESEAISKSDSESESERDVEFEFQAKKLKESEVDTDSKANTEEEEVVEEEERPPSEDGHKRMRSSDEERETKKEKTKYEDIEDEIPEILVNGRNRKLARKTFKNYENENSGPIEENLQQFLKKQDKSISELEGKMLKFGNRKIVIMGYPLPDELKGSGSEDDDDDDDYECIYRRSY